VKGKASEGK